MSISKIKKLLTTHQVSDVAKMMSNADRKSFYKSISISKAYCMPICEKLESLYQFIGAGLVN